LQAKINNRSPINPSDHKKSNTNFLDAWIEMLGVLYYYIPLCLHKNFLLNWSKPLNQVNVLCNMFLSRIIPVILKMKLKDTNGIILKQMFTILPFIIMTSFMLRWLINIYFRLSETCNTY
jgi:TRAP-type mannitol/chloroaromatic compound transport system permease small subunit